VNGYYNSGCNELRILWYIESLRIKFYGRLVYNYGKFIILDLQPVKTLLFTEVNCGLDLGRVLVLDFHPAISLSVGCYDVLDRIVVL